jgi:hypothetical protein
MPKSSDLVTHQSVNSAINSLKEENRQVSIRAVREKLGGGSLSSIHAMLKKIRAEIPEVPIETEAKLRPLLTVGAELIKTTFEEVATTFRSELDQRTKDLDFFSNSLAISEAAKQETLATIEQRDAFVAELSAGIKQLNERLEAATNSLEESNNRLIRMKIREEDFLMAKKEAAEACDRAARLEGRLEEIERKLSTVNEAPVKKEQSKKSKV